MMISATTNFDYNVPRPWLSLWWKMRNGKLIPRCAAREGVSENCEDQHYDVSANNGAWEILLLCYSFLESGILVRFLEL